MSPDFMIVNIVIHPAVWGITSFQPSAPERKKKRILSLEFFFLFCFTDPFVCCLRPAGVKGIEAKDRECD